MNEIIALQKYENEAQLAKELIRGFWLAHGDYVITDEEAAENLAAWTDKGHVFYFILKEEIPIGFVHLGSRGANDRLPDGVPHQQARHTKPGNHQDFLAHYAGVCYSPRSFSIRTTSHFSQPSPQGTVPGGAGALTGVR